MKAKRLHLAAALIVFSAALVIAEVPKRPAVTLKHKPQAHGKHFVAGGDAGKGNLANRKTGFGNNHSGPGGIPTPSPTPTPMPTATPSSATNFGN